MVDENNHIFNFKFEQIKRAFEGINKKREAFGIAKSLYNNPKHQLFLQYKPLVISHMDKTIS